MNLNKGISTPIAILLIVVVVAVAGVVVWQLTKPAETPEPTPKQPSDYTAQADCESAGYYWYEGACHETEQGKISDWKTYRSEEHGFALKYPADWTVEDAKKKARETPPGVSIMIPAAHLKFKSPNYSKHSEQIDSKKEAEKLDSKVKQFIEGACFSLRIGGAKSGPGKEESKPCDHSFVQSAYPSCPSSNGEMDFSYVEATNLSNTRNWKHFVDAWEAETKLYIETTKDQEKIGGSYYFQLRYNPKDQPNGEEIFNEILSSFRFVK